MLEVELCVKSFNFRFLIVPIWIILVHAAFTKKSCRFGIQHHLVQILSILTVSLKLMITKEALIQCVRNLLL